jgi:hypothetical protein
MRRGMLNRNDYTRPYCWRAFTARRTCCLPLFEVMLDYARFIRL